MGRSHHQHLVDPGRGLPAALRHLVGDPTNRKREPDLPAGRGSGHGIVTTEPALINGLTNINAKREAGVGGGKK